MDNEKFQGIVGWNRRSISNIQHYMSSIGVASAIGSIWDQFSTVEGCLLLFFLRRMCMFFFVFYVEYNKKRLLAPLTL